MSARPAVNPRTLEAVAQALPARGLTPREINRALPDLPRSTVCAALLALVRGGRATFDGEIGARRYRRAAVGEAAS